MPHDRLDDALEMRLRLKRQRHDDLDVDGALHAEEDRGDSTPANDQDEGLLLLSRRQRPTNDHTAQRDRQGRCSTRGSTPWSGYNTRRSLG